VAKIEIERRKWEGKRGGQATSTSKGGESREGRRKEGRYLCPRGFFGIQEPGEEKLETPS
jgi:hypothetical protein